MHAAAGADVGEDVVNIEDTHGRNARGVNGGLINLRLGLAGSYAAGIDAGGKVPKECEVGFQMGDMKAIRVGEKYEAASAGEAREEMAGENRVGKDDAIPSIAEFAECEAEVETLIEVSAPIVRGEAAFLPILP